MTTQTPRKHTEHENIVPFRPMGVLEEMEQLFENFIPRGWMRPFSAGSSVLAEGLPHVDVIDQDATILVRAALPGVKKGDLDVSSTDHTVTIHGKTREETRDKKGEYYRHEISTGNFLRTVSLPAAVDESRIKAKFKDGLLEVTLPKLESAKRHAIKVEGE